MQPAACGLFWLGMLSGILQVAGFVGSELQALQALGCNWQPGACGIQAAQVVGWESFRLQEIQVLGPGLFKL